MSIKAKPCPFCGSTDLDTADDYVVCNGCTTFGPSLDLPPGVKSYTTESEKARINDWNRRTEAPPIRGSDIPYSAQQLVQRALAIAKPAPGERDTPRWALAQRMFGTGQTVSELICFKFGFDPDKEVAAPYQDTGEDS